MTSYLNCYWKQDWTNLPRNGKERFEYWTKSATIGQNICKIGLKSVKIYKNLQKFEKY